MDEKGLLSFSRDTLVSRGKYRPKIRERGTRRSVRMRARQRKFTRKNDSRVAACQFRHRVDFREDDRADGDAAEYSAMRSL